MNFMGKSGGIGEDKEENQQSCYHHQQQQPPLFSSPPSYHQHHGGWLPDCGEPSSNQKEQGGWMTVEREHMFDKVVTPSDVGKLNRLVIPKQHAERYFPLDSSTNYKGLLLNFEDRNGKLWRFQYSYWNSSQSYVMTKGWSRFVKEKKLDAGDVVSFQRGVGVTAKDRLFIDWRRHENPSITQHHQLSSSTSSSDFSYLFQNHNFIHPWNPLVLQSFPARRNPNFMLQASNSNPNRTTTSRSVYFEPPQQQFKMTGLGFDPPPAPAASIPPVLGKASGKQRRLRLFGVNMDCVFSDDENNQDYDHPITGLTVNAGCSTINPLIPSSSSFSTIPYLQLTPTEYNHQSTPLPASCSTHDFNIIEKPTVSNMSLDLKISHSEAEI